MVPRKYGSGRGVGEACGPGVLPEPRPRLTVTEIRFKADASLHAVLRDMTTRQFLPRRAKADTHIRGRSREHQRGRWPCGLEASETRSQGRPTTGNTQPCRVQHPTLTR